MPRTLNLLALGQRIRATRLARRLTLEAVVSRSGFTVSWLSKVENGQLAPSLEGLVTIATALDCGVETLVTGLATPPRHVIVRRGAGRCGEPRDGLVSESLTGDWRGRHMQPAILHVEPPGTASRPDHHDGERFLFVLEGDVVVTYGEERLELASGDSVYLLATIPHAIVPAGPATARVLSVSCGPADATGGPRVSHRPDGRASPERAAKTRGRASDRT